MEVKKIDLAAANLAWFADAGQQPEVPTPNARQVAFYIGTQIEELSEKLTCVFGAPVAGWNDLAKAFKAGEYDEFVAGTLEEDPKELLDADIDLLWVSLGAARAQGADVLGAWGEVSRANQEKRWPEDGTFHLDPAPSKVIKPEDWRAPDLTPFVHPSLLATAGKLAAQHAAEEGGAQ